MKKFCGIIFIVAFVFSNCSSKNKTAAKLLDEKKFQQVFKEILLAETYTSNFYFNNTPSNRDSIRVNLMNNIFKKYKTSREQFLYSLKYYEKKSENFSALMDSVYSSMNAENVRPLPQLPIPVQQNNPKVQRRLDSVMKFKKEHKALLEVRAKPQ